MPSVGGNYGGNTTSMVATEAFPRPPSRTLPLSKGGDLTIDFLQMIDGQYANYASGVTVTLQIDTTPQIVVIATISTYHAVCQVPFVDADSTVAGTPWRCIVGYPTTPTTEIVAMNGVTTRADG